MNQLNQLMSSAERQADMIERIENEPIAVYTMSRKTDDRQADRQTGKSGQLQ